MNRRVNMKKTAIILVVCLIAAMLSVCLMGVSAAETEYVMLDMADGNILITKDDFAIGTSEPITYRGNYLIKYTGGGSNTLKVQGAKCRIIFDNVNMSVTKQSVTFEKNADVTLVLRGSNSVKFTETTKVGTAIAVGMNSKLTIESETGTDSLEAYGGPYGAGIGSTMDSYDVSAQIVINSGIITASSGNTAAGEGAGIGGARFSGAQVTINGGVINATGIRNAPGIGAGRESPDGSTVTINGGVINATSNQNGNGIGGGYKSGCQTITVNGGVVNASSSLARIPGIGGGVDFAGECKVYINGGSVYSVAKGATAPDVLTPTRNAESTEVLKLTEVTLPMPSDYIYIDSVAYLLPGTHTENSNVYYFWLEETATHTFAFSDKTASAVGGTAVSAIGWTTSASAVTKPVTEPAESETEIFILPSDITQESVTTTAEETEPKTETKKETSGTEAPEESATSAPDETTTAPVTEQKGCKSMLGAGGAVLLVLTVAVVGTSVARKKDE